jgi:hypothetical protein
VISGSVAVFTLVVHGHPVGIGMGACMVDAGGVFARGIVLRCVPLSVYCSID